MREEGEREEREERERVDGKQERERESGKREGESLSCDLVQSVKQQKHSCLR